VTAILDKATVIGGEFALSFVDGFEIYLVLSMLRRACPCASCQGEPDGFGRVVIPDVKYGLNAFRLKNFETVGGYAIQLFWEDGHSTGIYSYSYLKRLAEVSLI
jgi:DUF971 family protein